MNEKSIVNMIKMEQMALFRKQRKCSYKRVSELFDRYHIWEFIDDTYEGLHVQGALATYEDIQHYMGGLKHRDRG
jgi:hypothetical protein